METKQLMFWNQRSQTCPFTELIEDDDDNCLSFGNFKSGYEFFAEDHPDLPKWLADVKGVGFGDIKAQSLRFNLPNSTFIPVVARGSQKILKDTPQPFVGVSIGDVVTGKSLSVPSEIRSKFGIDAKSKIILFCFGKDELIERIWTNRKTVFPKIASLDFDLVTGINYSIWLNQPHAERLINLKRSLVTFTEFQKLGVPAIPHMYWYGHKDILRWCEWVKNNKNVNLIAVDPQTERKNQIWEQTVKDLGYFVSHLDREIHFLIIGPSTQKRIDQLKKVLPKFSLANGSCSRRAACGFLIKPEDGVLKYEYSEIPRNIILMKDVAIYQNILNTQENLSKLNAII